MTARRLSRIRGLLFDKDGTLINFERTWAPINREVARLAAGDDEAGYHQLLDACGYDEAKGTTRPGSIFAAAGLAETVDFITKQRQGRVPANLTERVAKLYADGGGKHAVLIEGMAQAIEALRRRGYVLGVATNDTHAGLLASLGRCHLLDPFTFQAGCDSGYGAKPDPGMIHAFARQAGLALDQVAMIGDSSHDMETAHRAGPVLRVAVLTGTGTRADLEPAADLVLDHVRDLLAVLPVKAPTAPAASD
jgi:phosphoglycolate phosphatase